MSAEAWAEGRFAEQVWAGDLRERLWAVGVPDPAEVIVAPDSLPIGEAVSRTGRSDVYAVMSEDDVVLVRVTRLEFP
jgi:hypothetical protein